MQDFTGVPAVVDLAAMRDAMAKLGGDPQKINPLVPVHLVIDHSVMVDEFGTPKAFEQNVALEYERNSSATSSSNGARARSTISRSCRPAPASATRSISNISPAACGARPSRSADRRRDRLSRHAGRHRQPHDDGQRPRRARLGRRRHRGRGGDARPAGLDADPRSGRLPPDRRAQGRDHRDRSRAHRHPDAARRAWSAASSSSSAPASRALSLADRATIANMAPEYGATCGFFGDRRQDARLHAPDRPAGRGHRADRGLCQGAGPVARSRRAAIRSSPTRSSSTWRRVEPSLAGPKRPQDKVLLSQVDDEFVTNFDKEFGQDIGDLQDPLRGRRRQ